MKKSNPDNDKTVIAQGAITLARTLWSKVVTVESSPDVTIKATDNSATETIVTTVTPSKRRITNPGEVIDDDSGIDFKIEDILGRGGMGVVYKAKQESLNRQIAVKVMDYSANENSINRFFSEAVVTGNLDHPNIVPIYDLGSTDEGKYFYAMKEISGESWDKSIATNSLPHNLRILFDVCDAVAFAHSKRIIHLDIKPENVMLGQFGETLLIDWGIAVILDHKSNTAPGTGKLSGTPAYMAPEMAACKSEKIGTATDIYLLGGILYEIITGKKPHSGINIFGTISAAMENIIQPTDKENELIDIALKAMATEPEDRYASVKEFQLAIRKYQKHAESILLTENAEKRLAHINEIKKADIYLELTEIVVSFQQALQLWDKNIDAISGLAEARIKYIALALKNEDLNLAESQIDAASNDNQTYNFSERNNSTINQLKVEVKNAVAQARAKKRLIIFSITVAVIGAIATFIITYAAYFLTCRERDAALAAKQNEIIAHKKAIDALTAAQNATYFNQIVLADNYLEKFNPEHAEELLYNAPARLRNWEWGYLAYRCRKSLLTIKSHLKMPGSCAFSADGKLFVIVDSAKNITVWNSFSGKEITSLQAGTSRDISNIAFDNNSNERVNMATYSGGIRTWNIKTAKELSFIRLEQFPEKILATSFSPQGNLFAGITKDNKVYIWNTQNTSIISLTSLQPPPQDTSCIAITDIADKLACGGNNNSIKIYDITTGRLTISLSPQTATAPLTSLTFSPDGQYLAVGTAARIVQIWDIKNKKTIQTIPAHKQEVAALAFSRTGNRLISTGSDGLINIFDAHPQTDFLKLHLSTNSITGIAYSPDGRSVAFIADNNTAKILNTSCWQVQKSLMGHTAPITSVIYSPDNKYILTAGRDKVAILYDAQSGEMIKIFPHPAPVLSASFSFDSRKIVTTDNSSAFLWDVATGKQLTKLSRASGDFKLAGFSHSGNLLVTVGRKIIFRNSDTYTNILSEQSFPDNITCMAFSPNGKLLITGGQNSAIIWNTKKGNKLFTLHGNTGAISSATFSPDGKRIVTGSLHSVTIWDTITGKELLTIPQEEKWAASLAFSPDGNLLLTGYGNGSMSIKASLPLNKAARIFQWKQDLYNTWLCHYNINPEQK